MRALALVGLLQGAWGCDAQPEDVEGPFADLAHAAMDASDEQFSFEAPSQAVAGFGISADRGCVFDSDGDDTLSLDDYNDVKWMPVAQCRAKGGAVLGGVAGVKSMSLSTTVLPSASFAQQSPTAAPGGTVSVPAGAPIPQAILDWVAETGIPDNEYVADDYDCDDFARDLELAFETIAPGAGTFTYMACDFDKAKGNYTWAHAITDVHGDGAIAWIEPQTGQPVDLDKNGDGKVTFATDLSGYPMATDGDCYIAVFDSAAAAEAAGLKLD